MYVPAHFEMADRDEARRLIERYPLGVLVTHGRAGLCANHVPFLVRQGAEEWILAAHVSRANPVWREHDGRALAVFTGPDAYVSPAWYPSKRETGRVVPTWNYAAVHVHGDLRAIEDEAWLLQFVTELTDREEAPLPAPWSVSDAPENYVAGLLKAIVGIEIRVEKIEAKWKVSQNRDEADARGAAEGLRGQGAEEMARLVELRFGVREDAPQ